MRWRDAARHAVARHAGGAVDGQTSMPCAVFLQVSAAAMPARPRPARFGRGLTWLALMSTAVLLAVIVTHDPGQPPDRARRQRRLIGTDGAAGVGAAGVRGTGGAGASGGVTAAGGRTTAATSAAGGVATVLAAGGDTLSAAEREACIVRATTGPTPVHGWVEKAGSLPMQLLDGPATKQRHQAYFAWRDLGTEAEKTQEAVVNGVLTRVGRPPPLFPYCRILINHAYRTMYLKAPKTGSTSLLTLLGTCTGNTTTDKPTCFRPLEVMESEEDYDQMYGNYFVFTVVRNPFARAVSSYRMLSRYMRHGCKDLVGGWNKVCMDVNHLALVHNQHPLCTINKQVGEGFATHHLIPQAPCLVTGSGEWAADYVVRTENLAEDMQEVLNEMNARRLPDSPQLEVEELLGKLTNVNGLHVACRGQAKQTSTEAAAAGAAGAAAAAGQAAGAATSGQQLSKEIAAISRRKALAAKQRVVHLEAPESYCSTEMYYEGQHSQCFDALAAYYEHDVRLFGLPICR